MNDDQIDTMTAEAPEMGAEDEAAKREREEALAARVEAFGASLVSKRDEAVSFRAQSGIEEEWAICEEAYQGIDDANRGQVASTGKPSSPNGGYVNGSPAANANRSTVFMNITRPYVDACAARVGDMLMTTDDTAWSMKPTPKVSGVEAPNAQAVPQQGMLTPPGQPPAPLGQPGQPGQPMPGQPPMAPAAPVDPEEGVDEEAKKRAAGATKQIEDWHIECQYHAEMRKGIEDAARLGTLVLKGPFPVGRTSRKARSVDGGLEFLLIEEIKPASKAISPWNFYPDPGCGEDIQHGSYCWEADTITARALRELKGVPGYIASQIDKVLEEEPGARVGTGAPSRKQSVSDKRAYPIWYYHGLAEREDLEAAGVKIPVKGDVSCPCMVVMVNDHVIKASLNPLDSGEFPYDLMPWSRKAGLPWGTGVAAQINTPQRMLNAATRNMMDNSGLSSGPQIVLRKSAIIPANQKYEITPRKLWFANEETDVQDIRGAFVAVNIPTQQAELQNIINFALKMAEDVTGMPMMMQGQTSPTTPQTLGGQIMQQNNASVTLRRIARLFDDRVTERHIRRYYEYLMIHGEDDSIKGDFQIDARGSTALVERDIQNQQVLAMGQFVLNPAFGIDPEKWMVEAMKAQRLDPKRFQLDATKKAQMAQQPPPKAPQVEAAEIRANADVQKTQIMANVQVARTQADTDRDTVYVQAETERSQLEHQARMAELEQRERLAMLDYANKNNVTLEQIKADLAKTAMKINSVKELAGMKASADAMPKPPIEPAGRAAPGMSYQQ